MAFILNVIPVAVFLNAFFPTFFSLFARILTVFSFLQSLKEFAPSELIFFPSVAVFIFSIFLNASESTAVTLHFFPAEFVKGVRDEFMEIALKYAGDTLTSINNAFRNSTRRAREWEVVDTRLASKITSLGTVKYEKTLFKSKTTGEYAYLVDSFLGFESHERLTEDALEEMLKEAVQTSYRRGGEAASIMDRVSKQTVKNHLHALEFPSENESEKHEKKRVVKKLFIEADEDHIHLQFKKRKGDLRANKLEKKLNGAIVKLVYVHEGIERVAPKSKRHRMINIHYFAGTYEEEKNKELWDEVYAYQSEQPDWDMMLLTGAGDCFASRVAVYYLCRELGIKAYPCNSYEDHGGCMVRIDDDIYMTITDYGGEKPRKYDFFMMSEDALALILAKYPTPPVPE